MNKIILSSFLLLTPFMGTHAERILLETEAFSDHGGWKLDTQFIREMGSPYLLAHGLGTPVKDATTTFEVKEAGSYQLFARTRLGSTLGCKGTAGTISNHYQWCIFKSNLWHPRGRMGLAGRRTNPA